MEPTQSSELTLDERLAPLREGLLFRSGQPRRWSDGVLSLSIDPLEGTDGRVEHLVTVFAGYPPPPEVRGLAWAICATTPGASPRSFTTDRRGQFRAEVGAGEYTLQFRHTAAADPLIALLREAREAERPVLAAPAPATGWELGKWEFGFSLSAAAPETDFEFPCVDGLGTAWLRSSSGLLELVIEVQPKARGDGLVRFEMAVDDALRLTGFVGLYEFEGGKGFGTINLSNLGEDLDRCAFKHCTLALTSQPRGELRPEDRAALERSCDASLDASREVLEEALRELESAGGDSHA